MSPSNSNTINLGKVQSLNLSAVRIDCVPSPIQQAPQPPRMRLEIKKVGGLPALEVVQDCETLLTIYTEKDGRVWGSVTLWHPGADGERQPFFTVGMRDVEAVLLLRQLLAGLDFAAARKAREAVAP